MRRLEIVEKLINEGISEKTLSKLTDKQLTELSVRMLGESADVMISKKDPLAQQKIADAKKQNKSIETYEEHGVGTKVTKGHNGIPEFMDSKKLKEEKPSAGLSKEKKSEVVKKAKKGEDIGKEGKGFEKMADKASKKYGSKEKGEKVAAAAMWKNVKRESVEEKKWIENLAEENFFHILTSKDEIMEMITSRVKPKQKVSSLPDFLKWDSLKALDAKQSQVSENGTTTKPAPVKPKVDPGTKPKHPLNPGKFPKPKPKAERDPETGKILDKPINPIGEPYKVEKGRKFNEPEEPKTNPKRKEEKKEKDHPVPQQAAENTTKPAPAKPKVAPDTKPKHPLNPGKFPKPNRKA
jgi:hypothetical protein